MAIFIENACRNVMLNMRLPRFYIFRKYCDKKDKSNDTQNKPVAFNEKVDNSKQKLKSLLESMMNESSSNKEISSFARPNKLKSERKKEQRELGFDSPEKNIRKATHDVAEHLGGDIQQTESELLSKLLLHKENSENVSKNLSDLIVGMKIDREQNTRRGTTTRSQYVKQTLANATVQSKRISSKKYEGKFFNKKHIAKVGGRVELFGGVGLGIFNKDSIFKHETLLHTVEHLKNRDLKLAIMQPPENYFQKMIVWTEQKKFWRFPIDNEYGLKENNVYFAEHVFLDTHLEPWCPTKGPIRHFMELVCVGLSKNPYLTVQEKINHIEWFKNYFAQKADLLKEVGAISNTSFTNENNIKELA
uniref:Small ribosomal subunit protein mS31 n=1 Tax=Xenopsylla cheopis TaxID=163159 RepID=A0A6M2DNA0_XENCH